jgi:diguanylate cyclase (GGDEF)-like protein
MDPFAMAHRLWRLRSLQLSYWIRLCTGVILLVLVAAIVLLERRGQEDALLHAEDQAATLAHSLAQHAGDTFQMADLALVSLSRLIGSEAPTRSKLATVNQDMRELLGRVPRIHSLDYYEESGWRLASSAALAEDALNQSRSAFFRFHRRNPDAGLFIGPPKREAVGGPWLITLSRRIAKEDGSFSGVLVATIESRYFGDFYASFGTGSDVREVLLGADGKLLGRNPYDPALIGRDMSGTPVYQKIRDGISSGTSRMKSPIDGEDRISAYHVVGGEKLAVVSSVSREAALAPWQQGIYVRASVFVLLGILIVLGGLRLARQAERRQASEKSLLQLSRTDALTGLLNRRAFDQAIDIAWLHCIASGKPLSLLMIDVDCFKSFNDTYGHPAGDTCLQIVALAIKGSVHFPDDRAMRYGGEEFVVILPETPTEQAMAVAQRIRTRILEMQVPHARSSVTDHVTVSIGCATERRELDSRAAPGQLLADADRALYQAKLSGRNRVVSNEVSLAADPATMPHLRVIETAGA